MLRSIYFISLFAIFALGNSVDPYRSDEYNEENRKWIFIPDGYGKPHLVDLTAAEIAPRFNAEIDVVFNLFTRKNLEIPQILNTSDISTIKASNFKSARPTRITVHGWRTVPDAPFNVNIRKAYLEHGDFNVIVVDWYAGASSLNYISSKNRVPSVGQKVAALIDCLVEHTGMSTKDVHIVGHSLGAHIAGIAGRKTTKGNINTVIGLDPALPLFSIKNQENRISNASAEYVEIIHTNGGRLGFSEPLGHADFYPNGKGIQPGCAYIFNRCICSHSRAYEYFIETFEPSTAFWSYNCESYQELMKGKCKVINKLTSMGAPLGFTSNHNKAKGIFFNRTNKDKPYPQERPDENVSEVEV